MAARCLVERVEQPFLGVQVDPEAGVIRGVKLCGFSSANGNDYPAEMFKRDIGKYDGAPINFNHKLKGEPLVEDVGGRIRNPRVDSDGTPRGDAHFLKSHPMTARVLEAAKSDPGLFGFSHVAECDVSRGKDGRTLVESIRRVVSVDLVAQPATTKGLFESTAAMLTLKELAESIEKNPKATPAQKAKAKKLAEDMGDMPVSMTPPAASDSGSDSDGDTDPDSAISAGFKSAIMAVVEKAMSGDMDPKTALQKVKKLLAGHGDATDSTADDMPSDSSDDSGKSKESKAPAVDYPGILRECAKEGYTPGPVELMALAGLPCADDRKAFITEQRAKVPGEVVKSAGRKPGSATVGKVSESNKPVTPANADQFASLIRE